MLLFFFFKVGKEIKIHIMMRTKQTRRSTIGLAPRKQLATEAARKRKLSDDECDGTDKKRIKLNTNTNNVSDTSDDQQDEIENDISNTIQLKMNDSLKIVKNIFNSNCSMHQLLKYTKQLHFITEKNKKKLEELSYRKKAIASLRSKYQEKMKHTYSNNIYFNENIFHAIKTTIKGLRYCTEKQYEERDYHTSHYCDYKLDIALKSKYPHEKYSKMLHDLLSNYIGNIKDISMIISQYSDNGYRWYGFNATEQTDSECDEGFEGYNCSGIFFSRPFDSDDYFRDINYYKVQTGSRYYFGSRGKKVSFASLRTELKSNTLNNMSDEELACFLVAIWKIEFKNESLDDNEEWIAKVHQ
eukprot:259592_1